MPVPRELTQPPGDKLIDYDGFIDRLQQLAASPRVKLELLDRSAEGRGIYAIVIADERVIPDLEAHRARAARMQRPLVTHQTLRDRRVTARPEPSGDLRYSATVIGQSFGHEASHVEALVELAERLAWGDDADTSEILSRLIVQIVPMMNPDGRAMAVELWKQYPLAEDGSVGGNRYGFFINRDFLHLTQPEGKAILKVFRDWHPLALYDTHEDAFLLAVHTPEVCWFPEDGVTSAGQAPRNIQEIVSGFGAAIREAWDKQGYNYYRKDMFAYPMLGQSPDQPHRIATGNITGSMSLHGIPSLITESARTPGSQTWEDRIGQKVTAGIAILRTVARTADEIATTIYGNAERLLNTDDGYVIPRAQPETGAVARLIETLLLHEVAVYETDDGYVVPLAQPTAPLINELLDTAQSTLVAMPPAMGVQVLRADDSVKSVPLRPVVERPAAIPRLSGRTDRALTHIAVPNTLDGVRLLNRLWHVGTPVYWLDQPLEVPGRTLEAGSFVLADVPSRTFEALAANLYLDGVVVPPGATLRARPLRKPGVSIYVGQGVDRPTPNPIGDIWWGLENLEFDFLLLEAEMVSDTYLGRGNIVIVPEGNARDIVEGWHLSSRRSGDAWDLPGTPRGIGGEGVQAIRRFVEQGGSYLGFGAGGGLLATADYAGLIDLSVLHHSLGAARVNLRIADPDNPLVYGLRGSYDAQGRWQEGLVPAMYDTETMSNLVGGPIFKAGAGARTIAYYAGADFLPGDRYLIRTELFEEREQGVAVAAQSLGRGQVTVVGVRPGFRAFWPYTFKLVSNAVLLSAAGEPQAVTLA